MPAETSAAGDRDAAAPRQGPVDPGRRGQRDQRAAGARAAHPARPSPDRSPATAKRRWNPGRAARAAGDALRSGADGRADAGHGRARSRAAASAPPKPAAGDARPASWRSPPMPRPKTARPASPPAWTACWSSRSIASGCARRSRRSAARACGLNRALPHLVINSVSRPCCRGCDARSSDSRRSSFRPIAPFSRRKGAKIPWHAAIASIRRAVCSNGSARRRRRSRPDFGAAGLWRFAGLGGARAPPVAEPRPPRLARGAAGADRRRGAPGAEIALSRFLPGGLGHRQSGPAVRAPRRRCLRRDLRPPAGARSCRPRRPERATGRRWSAPTGCCASRWRRNMAASTPRANSTSAR